jgi:hypothetical protein
VLCDSTIAEPVTGAVQLKHALKYYLDGGINMIALIKVSWQATLLFPEAIYLAWSLNLDQLRRMGVSV